MQGKIKLCFLCTGNTCRSFMAERLMKKRLKETGIDFVQISSRGLEATGEMSAENACKALKALGASGAKRKSVKLKKFDQKTLYVAMTSAIKAKVNGRVIEMKDLGGKEIFDPYGGDYKTYLECAKQIDEACKVLTEKLIKIGGEL